MNKICGYCCNICPLGTKKRQELLDKHESVFDAVYDFEEWQEISCGQDCPYHMQRDWENPDGVEWWNMKNYERHIMEDDDGARLIGMLMTIDRYREHVSSGGLIPYDGWGYYCTADEFLNERSDYKVSAIDKKKAKGYKYVIWYNK